MIAQRVTSRADWLAGRLALLAKEKELTRLSDAIAATGESLLRLGLLKDSARKAA